MRWVCLKVWLVGVLVLLSLRCGAAMCLFVEHGRRHYMDEAGRIFTFRVPPQYQDPKYEWREFGFACRDDLTMWGVVNRQGELLLEIPKNLPGEISEGVVRVSKGGGKRFYVDWRGNRSAPFNEIVSFKHGYGLARRGRVFYLVDHAFTEIPLAKPFAMDWQDGVAASRNVKYLINTISMIYRDERGVDVVDLGVFDYSGSLVFQFSIPQEFVTQRTKFLSERGVWIPTMREGDTPRFRYYNLEEKRFGELVCEELVTGFSDHKAFVRKDGRLGIVYDDERWVLVEGVQSVFPNGFHYGLASVVGDDEVRWLIDGFGHVRFEWLKEGGPLPIWGHPFWRIIEEGKLIILNAQGEVVFEKILEDD